MTPVQVVFLITAATILISALMVVLRRNLVQAALFLVLTLFGVAVLFVLLEAPFLAVIQVLIYIGAIAILMLFAVMLTRDVVREEGRPRNRYWGLAAVVAVLLFEGLVVMLSGWSEFAAEAPSGGVFGQINELGQALVSPQAYVIPFEIASVLLLAALIGAIVVAWGGRKGG